MSTVFGLWHCSQSLLEVYLEVKTTSPDCLKVDKIFWRYEQRDNRLALRLCDRGDLKI